MTDNRHDPGEQDPAHTDVEGAGGEDGGGAFGDVQGSHGEAGTETDTPDCIQSADITTSEGVGFASREAADDASGGNAAPKVAQE